MELPTGAQQFRLVTGSEYSTYNKYFCNFIYPDYLGLTYTHANASDIVDSGLDAQK